jgi:hypothetical protein
MLVSVPTPYSASAEAQDWVTLMGLPASISSGRHYKLWVHERFLRVAWNC